MLLSVITWASTEHTTPPKDTEETTSSSESESDQRIEVWKVDSRSNGWTTWSEWSTCSRSCDGGVTYQLRRCTSQAGCRGEPVRYKICNMQPCPESHDFREAQCAAFNDIPYEGALFQWTPHYEDTETCALTCRGRPAVMENLISEEGLQAEEEGLVVIARLTERVHDGTRCRPGSLDMCIEGKCRRVGCDLRIGSTKKVDGCGVCGGDGTSCGQPLYHWETTPMSLCSATCGGGYKMSRPVCKNRVSGTEVEEQLCNASQRPEANVIQCNTHKCPPRWSTGEWGACSVSCGGGSRLRQVQCVEEVNSTRTKVSEHNCRGHRPRYQEPCNQMDCPKWHTSPWSGCSVSCGEGVQVRGVECRDNRDLPSVLCEPYAKPSLTQPCSTGISCPHEEESDHLDELLPGLYHTQPLVQPYPPIPAKAERLIGEQVVPSESTFIADDWGPCSVTCGEGTRKREVHCKIFLEFSRTIAKLPDKQCSGPKPVDKERCILEPCSLANRLDPAQLEYLGYTADNPKHEEDQPSTIRVRTGNPETKPEIIVRTCNEHSCPPRWNYSDFAPCSKSCGIGIQTRDVTCIHEVSAGGTNPVIVPHHMCPQPSPPDRQYCNVLDCPVKWHVSNWSKCSKSCGSGIKERKVECKQVMAQNHVVDRPTSMCPSSKPLERRPCNTKSCVLESDKPEIVMSNSSYIQHDPKKKKISVKIGGSATVFYGTMIKIKCHVKRYNRTKIQWAKDHLQLTKSKKFKISKKGALRIQNLSYRDSGTYTCMAGRSSADLTLIVKSRPGEFPSSEEIEKQNVNQVGRNRLDDTMSSSSRSDDHHRPFEIGDDHSHEQRPGEGPKPLPKKQPQNTRPRPTMPPSLSREDRGEVNMNRLDAFPSHSSTTLMSGQEQQLWPFQTFTNSRGHRMVAFPHEELTTTEESPFPDFSDLPQDEDDDVGHAVILGKGTVDNVKFEWMITDWSKCSQSCGGNGFQMRAAHCMVKLHNTTQDVDATLCEDAGLATPPTIRKCGTDDCPNWSATEWTPCEESRCFTWNTAMQRREVTCQIANTTDIDGSLCDENERPTHRQECYSDKCKGTWKVGEWSECAAACEAQGVKYRILQCVWYGTKKPAGNACREQPRPAVMKTCKGPPCPKVNDCKDYSKFCPNVKVMNMCRVLRYQQQCCHTCRITG
ncbi:no long nerve cord [Carabus blaptoides fortunei]